jgi:NDP-sugar pyrophosphorylase family protein
MGDDIEIGEGTVVEPGALIRGPVIIGRDTEVRHGAYIRGNVIIGNKCVVGHATEVKSSILMDGAKAGHFAYIGDSILGRNVNLGAGTKLANLKVTEGSVVLKIGGTSFDTGLRKFGAVIGDFSELGCNSVTNPGTLIGPHSRVYPCTSIKGFLPEKTIVKLRQQCSIITLQETPDDDKV